MDVDIVESISHRTPFGVRFLDGNTGTVVREGLSLSLQPHGLAGRPVAPFLTASGIYGFEGVSGLNAWEYKESAAFPGGRTFLLLCEDPQNRYLECSQMLGQANLQKPLTMPLYSLPARPAMPGLAVVRGHVAQVQGGTRSPAAFARIEAAYAGASKNYVGLSDARGEFALFLPPPDPQSAAIDPAAALPEKNWSLTLTFAHQPAQQQIACVRGDGHVETVSNLTAADLAIRAATGWRCFPDLRSLLTQSAVQVFTDPATQAATLNIAMPFRGSVIAATPASPDGAVWLAG